MNIFKKLRKEKKITQMELSKILNVRQTTISAWEVGVSLPDYHSLRKLSDYYNVTIDLLIGNKSESRTDAFEPSELSPVSVNVQTDQLSAEEKEIISLFREMTAPEREQWITVLKMTVGKSKNIKSVL